MRNVFNLGLLVGLNQNVTIAHAQISLCCTAQSSRVTFGSTRNMEFNLRSCQDLYFNQPCKLPVTYAQH